MVECGWKNSYNDKEIQIREDKDYEEKDGGHGMALSKKPVNGMKDILPAEMEIRDYVTNVIKETYRSFGFTPIETPCMENIANLSNKQGGENEKLIFKVLKRGEKLNLETAKEEADVVDFGMRYDLTVPLSRFYSNNANNLPTPFKALQIGSVWRADRPQRGRYRQFTQCDIDILGEPSNLAEIELITATTTTLGKLGFKKFEIRINERRILKAMAAYSGFAEEDYDSVFITLDKMDKIGVEGCAEELERNGYDKANIEKYLGLFKLLEEKTDVAEGVAFLAETLGEYLDADVVKNMTEIATAVNATKAATAAQAPAPEAALGAKEIRAAALRDLAPLLDKVQIDINEKFNIYKNILEENKDTSILEPAYRTAKELPDDTARANALLYLVETIDKR